MTDPIITEIKFFMDFEKEEAWLQGMSAAGWHLVDANYCVYKFKQGVPERRIYKIDCRYFKNQADLDDFITLFTDSGWVSVSPRRSAYNFYFYSTQGNPQTDIFSDGSSKARRYLRYAQYTAMSLIPIMPAYVVLYLNGSLSFKMAGYQTPGLWEMKGAEFVRRFLFETPFVLLRSFGSYLPIIILLFSLFFVWRYYRIYRQQLKGEG